MDKIKSSGLWLIAILICSNCYAQGLMKRSELQFNHLYVVVDSITYNKFLNNSFLQNDFANVDIGMPLFQKADSTAKTIYIRGETTYIELMGPENKFGEPVGAIGIGFSWDTDLPFKYDINDYLKHAQSDSIKFESYEFSWEFKDHKTVWYQSNYTNAESNNVSTWYSFYNPAFLSDLFQQPFTQYSNSKFLSKAYNRNKLLTDIVAVNLSCTKSDYERIISELTHLDAKMIMKNESSVTYQFPEFQFTMQLNTNYTTSALNSIDFKTKNNAPTNYTIGKVKIEVDENITTWQF